MDEPVKYPISLQISVAWGEMDAFGHVNNVVFFRYFESTRIAYMNAILGDKVSSEEFMPILASTECRYLRPVYFPDTLRGESAVTKLGNSSLTMAYRLISTAQQAVVAEGSAVVVNIDPKTGKGKPLEAAVRKKIEELQEWK